MSASPSFSRVLRQVAPTLSRRFFRCQQKCQQKTLSWQASSVRTAGRILPLRDAFQYQKRLISSSKKGGVDLAFGQGFRSTTAGDVEAVAQSIEEKTSGFPETSSNTVAYWLLASAASVFGIVVFGGWTRLTESGLSITEWKPVTGSLPPVSDADWAHEFLKYQSSPEFHLLNSRMTIEEFKNIYWMEWIHRVWGRAVGLSFVLPAAYFVLRKQVSKPMAWRLGGISALIGFQGIIGWWMVKSGLKDDLFAPGSHPRVSQYRLTTHLGAAFLCYTAMVWNGLTILHTNKILSKTPAQMIQHLSTLSHPALAPFKRSVIALTGLIFITAMSGGLVAGLDAGLIYNEFPYMGLGLTPPKSELLDAFFSHQPAPHHDLVWRNMLENPSLVQLDHRILATTTFTSVMSLWAWTKLSHTLKTALPALAKRGVHGVVGFVWLQVILGISTLIYLVPLPLASAHQAGSLALLTSALVLGRRCWVPKAAVKALEKRRMLQMNGNILVSPRMPLYQQQKRTMA